MSDDTGHPGTYGEGGGHVRDLVGKKKKEVKLQVKDAVTYMPPRDRQTARRKKKARAEEWIKSEDGITEKMTGPNGVYTRFVSTSPPESEQDDA